MSQEQSEIPGESKRANSPDYHEVTLDNDLKPINQNKSSIENNNNTDVNVPQQEIGDDVVYNLANSVVESLYTGSAEDSVEDMANSLKRNMQPSSSPSNENPTMIARRTEEDDDYDFELEENMLGSIVANAVANIPIEKESGVIENSLSVVQLREGANTHDHEKTDSFNSERETSNTFTKVEPSEDKSTKQQEVMKEDELEDAIANALKDQFQLETRSENIKGDPTVNFEVSQIDKNNDDNDYDDNNDIGNDSGNENLSDDQNLDLMEAINDALVHNMDKIQDSNADEPDEIDPVDEESELNAAIVDALRNTESVLKSKVYDEDGFNEQSHLNNEDLEGVIQEIDMNDVMQTALHQNEKESEYDVNHELNTAIKEALMTVPKKPTGLAPAKKNDNKMLLPKDKIDLSMELTNVISNALRDSGLVNRDNVNEFDIEAALKEVVSGVIEHNLVSQPQKKVEKIAEKEIDYNWDDIMDNAFEMAMQYPEDLRFDVDENGHANEFKQHLNSSSNKRIQSKITKKSSNRQQLLVPQSKPTGSLIKDLKNRFPLSVTSSKISAVGTVTNVLDSLRLGEIDVNDIFRLKASKLDTIKRNVSSVLSSLINSTSTNTKYQTPKDQLDEKEKLRLENRERKKRWREFNIERNRDLDLKTRVIKRANHLYPLPEHEVLKKEWIETEFKKRKQKRLEREQKKNISIIDIKNFDAKDVISFDTFFKNKVNLLKIVEIYNEMGGMVTEDKLLSSSADRTASVTCVATVIAASYLVEKEKQQLSNINHEDDDDDEYSIIQSLVVSVDKYLKNKDHIRGVSYLADNSKTDNWDVSISSGNELEKNPLSSAINLKPMKIAPVTGGATFKVNLDEKPVDSSSILQNQLNSNSMLSSGKLTAKFRHNGMMNTFGTVKKKSDDSKNKKKAKPLVINFEKFLVPNPPKPEVSSKRKGSFATQIINNMEPSLKKRLTDEKDMINIINNSNDFEIDYDMDDIDIPNNIDHEFNHIDNDAAKENLKMIEKHLNLQVQQMQSGDNSDEEHNSVDDEALASVVNQVVGALEDNYRDVETPKLSTSSSAVNIKDYRNSNLETEIRSVVKNSAGRKTDSFTDTSHSDMKKVNLIEDDVKSSVNNPKKDFSRIAESTNKDTPKIASKSTNNTLNEKLPLKKDDSNSDVTVKPKAEIKKKSKPKSLNQIPKIPLPQYGIPKPMNRITKIPTMKPMEKLFNVRSEPQNAEDAKIGGIKRPGAFRKPTAFKRPGEPRSGNMRPFGGISMIKKL